MKRTAGIAALIGGLLLILVPRFILPVCEYQGYQPMHCSDTARAELYAGILLAGAGAAILLLRRPGLVLGALLAVIAAAAAAFTFPEVYGYCKSPKMPCNYGTIPAIRLIAAATAITALIASGFTVKQLLHKDRS